MLLENAHYNGLARTLIFPAFMTLELADIKVRDSTCDIFDQVFCCNAITGSIIDSINDRAGDTNTCLCFASCRGHARITFSLRRGGHQEPGVVPRIFVSGEAGASFAGREPRVANRCVVCVSQLPLLKTGAEPLCGSAPTNPKVLQVNLFCPQGHPDVNQSEKEIEEGRYRGVLYEGAADILPGKAKLFERPSVPFGGAGPRAKQAVGAECLGDLCDPEIRELVAPGFGAFYSAPIKGFGHESVGNPAALLRGASDAVEYAAVVCAGIPKCPDALEQVVPLEHLLVVPSFGAEQIEVGEEAKLNGLQEHPYGHLAKTLVFSEVLGDEVARVFVVRLPLGPSGS